VSLLELREVAVSYGRIAALRGVSLSVSEGELVGVVGPNGAGKSTLLLTIAGVLRPSHGTIEFAGDSLARRRPEDIVRRGVCLVPERRHVFARLTVEENLRLGATTRRRDAQAGEDMERVCDRFPILRERLKAPANQLSGGEQQQLAIARALLARPRLLLVDEPSLGLSPMMVDRVFDTLEELRAEGATILLIEQNALATIEMADRTYVLRHGEISLEGTGEDLLARDDLLGLYMGDSYGVTGV
jgi:branched-chain amino acid transport system ATP-binding protein